MRLTNAGQTMSKNINPTQHWESNYKNVVADTTERDPIKSRRPMWSINRQAYSSSRGQYKTEFADAFGNHGHNPRETLPAGAQRQENRKFELSIGTTKVTHHIPGYNGFIPHTDINQNAVVQSEGESVRNTIIKQNIVENQSVRLPGY